MRRISVLLIAACLCTLGVVAGTQAAGLGRSAAKHHTAVKHPKAAKKVHGLSAPRQLTPTNAARVQQVPPLTWSAVSGAVEYEYQIAADPRFDSILGSGSGMGTAPTHNLAAALGQSIPDGTYYWRVRGVTAAKQPGAWSGIRTLVKEWTEAPQLLSPAEGAAITWPSVPLVMSWSTVSGATEYIVTVATDPALSNIVLGSATSPQKTDASVLALPGTLAAGQYYWAITPVDAEGHKGARSAVRTFTWSWPTSTATNPVANLSPDPRVFDPQFSWAPVPGAAKYEVQVSSAEEFPVGSLWCCSDPTIGTSLTPTQALANSGYYWRVRAVDPSGHAGEWNGGQKFTEAFDSATPTIPNLTMRNADGSQITEEDPATATPIVTWSPVPGAASYEVQVTHYVEGSRCNWSASSGSEKQTVQTSTLAWTPLSPYTNHIGPSAWPSPDSSGSLNQGNTPYCVRVLARSDHDARGSQVISNWTQIGAPNKPAFTFASQPAPGSPGEMEASDYLLPRAGSTSTRTPLFTWQRVPGAHHYYVVIARDSGFTHVIDIASTEVPAYAPQLGGEEPLDDQTTAYYWAVVPFNAKGEEIGEPPFQDAPQSFNKASVPPTPFAPVNGVEVANQPTFSWSPAEGALNYTLQVSGDPTFGNPIDNVRTDSTAYTSSSTYPADVTLYWRVRANDTNGNNEGLNWSAVQTFRRTLPVPSASPGNPTVGQGIPVLSWTPVAGATAYQVHVDQADGSTKDFTFDSTSFTPTIWYGTGIWHWEVRALFPSAGSSGVSGGYFSPQTFVRTLAPPTGAFGTKAGSDILITWNPAPYAKQYEIDLSTSETFNSTIESKRIDGLGWAPNVDLTQPSNRGKLFWRVAAVDQGGNIGPFATGSFIPPKPKTKCVVKTIKKKKKKTVKQCVVARHKVIKKKHH
jgi:hypothetical protein